MDEPPASTPGCVTSRSAGDSEDWSRQEIRVAVVLNGGVSLAVWISGVTLELHRLAMAEQKEERMYGPLLSLLKADAHIDVIAGTSVGGLNGACLALGVSRQRDLGLLHDLWRDHGSLEKQAKVVVAIGNSLNQHATFNYRDDLFTDKLLIHINISKDEINKADKAHHALVSDALGIAAITEVLASRVGRVPAKQVVGRDREARSIPQRYRYIHLGQLAQTIGRMLPPSGVLLADTGAHLGWLGYYVEHEEGQNFRKPGTFGPTAGHVNGSLGLKVTHPERPVVVGCGDGCYSLSGFELMTAIENDIPVIWVIFNDSEYELNQDVPVHDVRRNRTGGNPDFAAYARACGADGYRVDTLEEFTAAFAAAQRVAQPYRRPDHALGNSALRPVAEWRYRPPRRDDGAALPPRMKGTVP
jgi:Thiamine pyrophosphate enzyme, C-terminal TPP binding domain/Patatin-like phospholipase